jgi:hypothetical protein
MLRNMTRARLIRIWFVAVALVAVAAIALGAAISLGTAALLAAMCLVPPVLIAMLWPDGGPQTVAEIIHDAETAKGAAGGPTP